MKNLFNSVRLPRIKRNSFPLSFSNDFDTDFGMITPSMVIPNVNAGEIFKFYTESFVRTMPLRAPAFTSSDVSYHSFFVPYRLCYKDWSKFIVRGENGDTDYDLPYCLIGDIPVDELKPGSLHDFLNFPTLNSNLSAATDRETAKAHKVWMMVYNAYNLVYNEYFRDENLQPEVFIWDESGRDTNFALLGDYQQEIAETWSEEASAFVSPFLIRHRAWRKDYFTSALPFVQKGSPISLVGTVTPQGGNSVPVNFMLQNWSVGDQATWFLGLDQSNPPLSHLKAIPSTGYQLAASSSNHYHNPPASSTFNDALAYISLPELQTNVMTISDLRVALALQQWFELNARTGSSRYFEYLLGHFGVRDRDSRLQRPEYIGGFSHHIQISEVEQTSETGENTPQGNLAGRGLGYSSHAPFKYRCPEPGIIIQVQSIRPHAYYYQGWPRDYQRWDCFDFYDPKFDHLSEQAIKESEIYWMPEHEPLSSLDRDFGYTPRFSEYRTKLNEIHGSFRSSLGYWVSPRKFTHSPQLTSNFITIDGYSQSLYDMFAYPGDANNTACHFVCHVVQHVKAVRPMSKYATPYL